MKDLGQPEQSDNLTSEEKERWERDKVEDERLYQHYLETGEYISHEEMMAWFDELEQAAVSKAFAE